MAKHRLSSFVTWTFLPLPSSGTFRSHGHLSRGEMHEECAKLNKQPTNLTICRNKTECRKNERHNNALSWLASILWRQQGLSVPTVIFPEGCAQEMCEKEQTTDKFDTMLGVVDSICLDSENIPGRTERHKNTLSCLACLVTAAGCGSAVFDFNQFASPVLRKLKEHHLWCLEIELTWFQTANSLCNLTLGSLSSF